MKFCLRKDRLFIRQMRYRPHRLKMPYRYLWGIFLFEISPKCTEISLGGYLDLHHVIVHETCVLVFFFLSQNLEAVLFVERDGRQVGINRDEAERREVLPVAKQIFDSRKQFGSYLTAAIFLRYGKSTYLNGRVTAETFSLRETVFDTLPTAIGDF